MIINLESKNNTDQSKEIDIFTNQMIEKVTKNLENFHYNVLVANLHEIYNYLSKNIKNIRNKENLLSNYEKILKIISPVMPHLTNECLEDLNVKERNKWPRVDKNLLKTNIFNICLLYTSPSPRD